LPIPAQLPAWYGGPVASDRSERGIILHNQTARAGDILISEGIALSSVEASLETLVAEETRRLEALAAMQSMNPTGAAATKVPGFDSLYPYRYLSGYAGWGPGQLDEEIQAGAWLELPLDRTLIFHTAWHHMWDRAIATLGIAAVAIAPSSHSNTWLN